MLFASALLALTPQATADTLDWLPDDPILSWSKQLRLNLALEDEEVDQTDVPETNFQVLDWVFWREVRSGENNALRSKYDRHYIHEIAVCTEREEESEISLAAVGDDGDAVADEDEWAQPDQRVEALTDLRSGRYRVSVVLNDPPEAFHISAETTDGVRIHDFIRDREAQIQLVAVDGEESVAWRYSFEAILADPQQVKIVIEQAASGFVAFEEDDSLGPLGIVVEQTSPSHNECATCDNPLIENGAVVVIHSQGADPLQPTSQPIVFVGGTSAPASPVTPTSIPVTMQNGMIRSFSPFAPAIPPTLLFPGGGGGGRGPTGGGTGREGPATQVTNPTPVPEPTAHVFGFLMLVAASLIVRRARAAASMDRPSERSPDLR